MNRLGRFSRIAALAMAAAACGDGGGAAKDVLSPDGSGPKLVVGPTASVTVACPTKLDLGTSGNCVAFGYDANGFFTTNTATWSSSNTAVATVSSTGTVTASSSNTGSATITATINGYAGTASVTVANSGPPVAAIMGPSSARAGVSCDFYASVTGGVPPYTYSWSQVGGLGTSYGEWYQTAPSKSFTLYLTVTDANSQTSNTASKFVTVSSTAPYCP